MNQADDKHSELAREILCAINGTYWGDEEVQIVVDALKKAYPSATRRTTCCGLRITGGSSTMPCADCPGLGAVAFNVAPQGEHLPGRTQCPAPAAAAPCEEVATTNAASTDARNREAGVGDVLVQTASVGAAPASPTPRTDELVQHGRFCGPDYWVKLWDKAIDSHRQLEREVAHWKEGMVAMEAQRDAFLAARSATAPTDYYCWLIERGQLEGQQPTIWIVQADFISGDPYGGQWTEDPRKAKRFPDGYRAKKFADGMALTNFHVCEHIFMDGPMDGTADKR